MKGKSLHRLHMDEEAEKCIGTAIECFERAIKLDPSKSKELKKKIEEIEELLEK